VNLRLFQLLQPFSRSAAAACAESHFSAIFIQRKLGAVTRRRRQLRKTAQSAIAETAQQPAWQVTLLIASFYYMAAASVVSALLAVTRKNPVHSMLWVLALFLHVAGIFLLLSAEFLAAVQIIVYAGAILIFYVFVVMLLDLPDEEAKPRFGRHWPAAAIAGLCFASLAWFARVGPGPAGAQTGLRQAESLGKLSAIGMALFGPFALTFEITSLVLLAAIIGTVVITRRRAAGS
jgi:NADH-quinone oxidoreductase subunit J